MWINVCNKTANFSSACTFQSDLISNSYYGFNVFLDSPIKNGVRYHMEASISGGANSCFGENGHPSVVCSWVTFKLYSSGAENNNGTKVEQGQFPGLRLYCN